ncbi:sensor histidine kinase [Petralouisia muris]|nr:HAMP domain-containing sensor histidine kinase [Petralouisia muris]
MLKKAKKSIAIKTFTIMMGILLTCCIIIYGLIMNFLPRNYQTELEGQFAIGFEKLVQSLGSNGIEDSTKLLYEFSMKNNAIVTIKNSEGVEIFAVKIGDREEKKDNVKTFSLSAEFEYMQERFMISATATFLTVMQTYNILLKLIPVIMTIMILIAGLGAYIFSIYFSKPLIKICSVAKRMTKLDMTWKCDTSREDEIGILAISLNEMSEKLNDALKNLKEANEQLQLEIKNERKLEQQRGDFFMSVSHELKTPITIIKGELEGMIYNIGEYKNRDEYLRHALKSVESMEKLVKEILLVVRIGGDYFNKAFTNLNISEMLKKVCYMVQEIAEDKNIEFNMDIESEFYWDGDERLLKKVFSNIIGNAIMYSPQGEKVHVALKEKKLSVENTGVQIRDEELERIFEPFYRIDKSRNRNTGGSGLGLYIVKTILEHHKIPFLMKNTRDSVCFQMLFQRDCSYKDET